MKKTYRISYFENDPSRGSAERMAPFLLSLVPARSAVDIGCNRGQWLSVLKQAGVPDILGLDGPWVDQGRLLIPRESFRAVDLTQELDLGRRFDLVLSLEVAEHLPSWRAASFVEDLTRLGDVVLMSGAIPGQSGDGHVNEQWPDYWMARFEAMGYHALDVLRRRFWGDPAVFFFYAQNAFLYANDEALQRYPALAAVHAQGFSMPPSVVHPGLFARKMQKFRDRTWPGVLIKPLRRLWRHITGRHPPARKMHLNLPPSALIRI